MDPDPNTLAYLKYSRGYKSGGFNASTISVDPESLPEHLDAFELGGKEVFNRDLQINGALFYYNYTDKQIPLTLPATIAGGPTVSSIVNIPKVKSYGAEFETIWQPWANMQFLLDYAYLSATIKGQGGSCATPPPNTPNSCYANTVSGQFENTNGDTVPESPRSKVSANANYTWHFMPGSLNYSVSYVWKDKTADSIFNEQYFIAPSYTQVDMRLSWNDQRRSLHHFRLHQEPAKQAGLRRCWGGCGADADTWNEGLWLQRAIAVLLRSNPGLDPTAHLRRGSAVPAEVNRI